MKRKLALLIVEGGSDAAALTVPLRNFLRKSEANCAFECVVYHTDITLHNHDDAEIIVESYDVIERVKAAVDEYILGEQNSNKYEKSDIGLILTLSDLDGCYCKECDVVFGGRNVKSTIDEDNKRIVCSNVPFLIRRNLTKVNALSILNSTDSVLIGKNKIPFRAFYCSVNLEHVLHNDLLIVDPEEKIIRAKQWASKHKNDSNAFYQAIKEIPRLSDKYLQSWDEHNLRKKPFERLSNMGIMIDWLLEESKKQSDFTGEKEKEDGLF